MQAKRTHQKRKNKNLNLKNHKKNLNLSLSSQWYLWWAKRPRKLMTKNHSSRERKRINKRKIRSLNRKKLNHIKKLRRMTVLGFLKKLKKSQKLYPRKISQNKQNFKTFLILAQSPKSKRSKKYLQKLHTCLRVMLNSIMAIFLNLQSRSQSKINQNLKKFLWNLRRKRLRKRNERKWPMIRAVRMRNHLKSSRKFLRKRQMSRGRMGERKVRKRRNKNFLHWWGSSSNKKRRNWVWWTRLFRAQRSRKSRRI